jgi:hypothetical protein
MVYGHILMYGQGTLTSQHQDRLVEQAFNRSSFNQITNRQEVIKMANFFQKIKDSIKKAVEEEKALEAADPIAYRQMRAMEEMAEEQRWANMRSENEAALARLKKLQHQTEIRAALASKNQQLIEAALINSLN